MNLAPATSTDKLHGDEDIPFLTAAEESEREAALDRRADELLRSEAWWDETLCGVNEIERVLPRALARIMANLDSACSGDSIARDAITTAMSRVQSAAKGMARAEAEQEA